MSDFSIRSISGVYHFADYNDLIMFEKVKKRNERRFAPLISLLIAAVVFSLPSDAP
jgi:hypothetical protein